MKNVVNKFFIFVLAIGVICNANASFAAETQHPIDIQESSCRAAAQTTEQTVICILKAANYWSYEADKYYSLLHKKFQDEEKTAVFESQKYWNMHKNNDFKIIDSLYAKDYETPERLILLAEQKRNLLKNRAQTLLSYYIQTFPETENEDNKIPVNTVYKPDNFFIRVLHHIGF